METAKGIRLIPPPEVDDYVEVIAGRYRGCIGYVDDEDLGTKVMVVILRMPSGESPTESYCFPIQTANLRRLGGREREALKVSLDEVVEQMTDGDVRRRIAQRGGVPS
jgi:hypothetical protein